MASFIALFRGINVGGKNPLPMKQLSSLLSGLGLRELRTYIQSGNVVFQSEGYSKAKLIRSIQQAIGEQHGFTPEVLLLTVSGLRGAIARNPFPEGEADPKSLHLYFLAEAPSAPDIERLERLRMGAERFRRIGDVVYLHAPDGVGRSKLAANIEKAMGVRVTARNWRTVTKLLSLSESP